MDVLDVLQWIGMRIYQLLVLAMIFAIVGAYILGWYPQWVYGPQCKPIVVGDHLEYCRDPGSLMPGVVAMLPCVPRPS